MQTTNTPQGYFMIFAYAIFFIGVLISSIGWGFFKLRALTNKPAWDGIGGKMIKFGIPLSVIGLILVGLGLWLLSK